MLGYYQNEAATAEVFTEDGYFRTGDIGYMDKDGYIYITGRKKNVIILSNGKNVFPEELEEYLSKLEHVSEAVVVGRKNAEDAKSEVAITAIIVPDLESPALADKTPDEVYSIVRTAVMAINKKLPSFKHITDVEIRNEPFEKNSSRKIKRYKIK
jgi:long-chain acyl-CoA synthetase